VELGLRSGDSSGVIIKGLPANQAVGVVTADFNQDGIGDLAVITPGAELFVLLGVNPWAYRRSFRCRLDAHAGALSAADINGDGKLDLAIAHADQSDITLLYGRGDGTFSRPEGRTTVRTTTWSLTPRELQVARLAAGGYTCGEIATMLGISRRTAETHVGAVRSKLELKHKRQLVDPRHIESLSPSHRRLGGDRGE
jgi:DNA-binding CsgD family transcriptional regulator